MSQQYPGQPPFGSGPPPGAGGGFQPGQGGGIPPGPGYPPNAVAGMPGNAPPATGQPPKSNRPLMLLGIGCGLFLLLGLAAVVAGVLWFKAKANSELDKVLGLQASASAAQLAPAAPGELTGECKLAHACCQTIATKSNSGAAALEACELFKTAGYPTATCTVALTGYRKAAELIGAKCD